MAALTAVSSAGAATEVGNDCVGDSASFKTLVQVANAPGSALPASVPAAGVVTKWKANVAPFMGQYSEKLKVVRDTGNPNEFLTVAESAFETVVGGQNFFDARIPVQAGDHIGAYGPAATEIYCSTADPGDQVAVYSGDAPVGSIHTFGSPNGQMAVSAIVEPDADGDGYGDETQDGCPQSASIQVACPVVALDATAIAKKRSILLLVSASSTAQVKVYGQAKWGFKPKHKSAASKKLIVGLHGGTQTVQPGHIARFKVPLPKTVRRRLGRITSRESIKVTLKARATDLASRITSDSVKLKLKGRR